VTATPPDLPGFLLARASERADRAPDVHGSDCNAFDVAVRGGGYLRSDCDCGEPARVLADSAFKRALVRRFVETAPAYADARQQEIHETLRDEVIDPMAQLWSDHPAFDPSWRV
jgi:hypothetical protein